MRIPPKISPDHLSLSKHASETATSQGNEQYERHLKDEKAHGSADCSAFCHGKTRLNDGIAVDTASWNQTAVGAHLFGRMTLIEGSVTMIVSQEAEPNQPADQCCSPVPPFLLHDEEECDSRNLNANGPEVCHEVQ